jgi:MFS family permease
MGGILTTKIGGYESKHSILLCFILGGLAGAFSIPVPLVDTIVPFTIYLWLVLFFGGAIVPPITGIIISSLPLALRGSASSILNVFCCMLGYLPAPFAYGIIYDVTKDNLKRMAFTCLMYYSLIGFVLLSFAAYFRYKSFNNLKDKNHRYSYKSLNSLCASSVAKMFGTFTDVDTSSVNKQNTNVVVNEPANVQQLLTPDAVENRMIEEVRSDSRFNSEDSMHKDNSGISYNNQNTMNNNEVEKSFNIEKTS